MRNPLDDYYTVAQLCEMGWTKGLINRFLGRPDRLFPVNHWRNFHGKKAWLVSTVELIEMTQGFEAAFLHSAKFRLIDTDEIERVLERIYDLRESCTLTPVQIESDFERRLEACAAQTAELFNDARFRGYRTPHKC